MTNIGKADLGAAESEGPGNARSTTDGENNPTVTGDDFDYLADLDPPSSPQVLAYEIGRLLNHLSFESVQAWIIGGESHTWQAKKAVRELVRRVRLLLPSLDERDAYNTFVDSTIGELLNATRHIDELLSFIDEYNFPHIDPHYCDPDYVDLAAERRWAADRHVRLITEAIKAIETDLKKRFDPANVEGVKVGKLVDQGIRRPDIQRYMFDRRIIDRTRHLPNGGCEEVEEYQIESRLPGECSPEDTWLLQVEDHLREMKLLTPDTRGLIRSLKAEIVTVGTVAKVDAAVRDVLDNRKVLGTLPSPPHDSSPDDSTAGFPDRHGAAEEPAFVDSCYLRLFIDNESYVLRREGKRERIELTGKRLWWNILLKLIRKKGRYCTWREMQEVWGECGLQQDPQDGTMNDAISEVRSVVKSIGLKIPRKNANGWVLLDIDHKQEE